MKQTQEEKLSLLEQRSLLILRKKGKRGQTLSPEEQAFCQQAHRRDPEGYAEVERQLFEWLHTAAWWELL